MQQVFASLSGVSRCEISSGKASGGFDLLTTGVGVHSVFAGRFVAADKLTLEARRQPSWTREDRVLSMRLRMFLPCKPHYNFDEYMGPSK